MTSILRVDQITANDGTEVTVDDTLVVNESIELGHASDTTVARSSAGNISVEGNLVYRAGGTDVPVTDGGTGVSTLADGGLVVGNGSAAVEVVTAGATTDLLVGGGASTNPVWTTATGTGAPVRANSPTLVTPALGTPSSGDLSNCTGLPVAAAVMDNPIINPSGLISMRSFAAGNSGEDDFYGFDRWYSLQQTTSVQWTRTLHAEDGTPSMLTLTQPQAVAQRMGMAQIIEARNCKFLRGQVVTLSFRCKFSLTANLRVAIVEWTGADDVVTSDVVADWTSSNYTINNFFVNTTYLIPVASQHAMTASTFATVSTTATLGSTFTNLIVFIWTEAAAAQDATLSIAKVKLEVGSSATPFYPRSHGTELALCQRYFNKTYNEFTTQSSAVDIGALRTGEFTAANVPYCQWRFPVTMRTTPTITVYNPVTGTSTSWADGADASRAATAIDIGANGCTIHISAGDLTGAWGHAVADADL